MSCHTIGWALFLSLTVAELGLRIIPGSRSFLVLPKSVSRSSAVGTIFKHGDGRPSSPSSVAAFASSPPSSPSPQASWTEDVVEHETNEFEMVLTMTEDEHLIRRINRLQGAETCSTSGKGSDAMWRLDGADVVSTLQKIISR